MFIVPYTGIHYTETCKEGEINMSYSMNIFIVLSPDVIHNYIIGKHVHYM